MNAGRREVHAPLSQNVTSLGGAAASRRVEAAGRPLPLYLMDKRRGRMVLFGTFVKYENLKTRRHDAAISCGFTGNVSSFALSLR